MREILVLALLLCVTPAQADVMECVRACLDDTSTVTPAPTHDPSPETQVFPGVITFDETSDQGPVIGTACILLPATWAGKITAVSVNGEAAAPGDAYKGRPTFYLSKPGSQYNRPLIFTITATTGTYTATSGSEETGTSTGGRSESAAPSSCGNPAGANCRQNMRFSSPGSAYGRNIEVWIDGAKKMTVADGAQRTMGPNGMIWKPVSDNNKKLVIVGEYGKKYRQATVKY